MKTPVRQTIRQVFRFLQSKETKHDKHGNNGYVVLSDERYFVGNMSYDEWYLEPYRYDRTERDGFADDTLWERSDATAILQLFVDNGLIGEIKATKNVENENPEKAQSSK